MDFVDRLPEVLAAYGRMLADNRCNDGSEDNEPVYLATIREEALSLVIGAHLLKSGRSFVVPEMRLSDLGAAWRWAGEDNGARVDVHGYCSERGSDAEVALTVKRGAAGPTELGPAHAFCRDVLGAAGKLLCVETASRGKLAPVLVALWCGGHEQEPVAFGADPYEADNAAAVATMLQKACSPQTDAQPRLASQIPKGGGRGDGQLRWLAGVLELVAAPGQSVRWQPLMDVDPRNSYWCLAARLTSEPRASSTRLRPSSFAR